MQTIKLSDYFALKNPKYTTFQLIPSTSNRNYDTELIANTIASMDITPIYKRFHKIKIKSGFKMIYDLPYKCTFIIQIDKSDCKFYIIVPELYKTLFNSKCMEIWKRVTVKELGTFPIFQEGLRHSLSYVKEDALSLRINKKSNEPLNNIMAVKSVLLDDEEIDIFANFIPINQKRWKGLYSGTMLNIKMGLPVDKEKLNPLIIGLYLLEFVLFLIDTFFFLIGMVISGGKISEDKKQKNLYIHDRMEQLSIFTKKKETAQILKTQLLINSVSKNPTRAENNLRNIAESYKVISQDNILESNKLDSKQKFDPLNYTWHMPRNIMSTSECNNFSQLPGRDLLQSLHVQTKVDVLESDTPEELQKGSIPIGKVTYKDKTHDSYFPIDYNIANLVLMLLGSQGAGKSNFIGNFCKFASKVGEANIILDYIKNCELSDAVSKVVDKHKLIIIDLSQRENFQAFAFNEIQCTSTDELERFEVASMKAEQTLAFIDSINKDGIPLTGNMRRILSATSNVVYLHNNTSIGDVINCLEKHVVRGKYIEYIRENLSEVGNAYMEDMIDTLKELDKVETELDRQTKEIVRQEVTGTKRNEIVGILDRIDLLKENINCRFMFGMKSEGNIDFVKAMEEGKTILIKMPEHKYGSKMVKNILTTFFTSKIMLATKLRGALHDKPNRTNVFYDEISQSPTCMVVLKETLSQLRKFGTKIVISAHHLDQLTKELKEEVKGSGASYMLFQGCDKKVFDELKDEFLPYEIEDLLNLKQFHTLNLIKTSQGYQKFISHLPSQLF